jgi:hypothetical protein
MVEASKAICVTETSADLVQAHIISYVISTPIFTINVANNGLTSNCKHLMYCSF